MTSCEICGREMSYERQCILCKRKVCPSCFRMSMSACIDCIPGKKGS
ncbi:MAG: hypothetical protein JW825_05920 [Candidatus Methanofastidiosa archaeon]|nr:hypothetical protein [Candidatus Methanofastidiosa archaeon]